MVKSFKNTLEPTILLNMNNELFFKGLKQNFPDIHFKI